LTAVKSSETTGAALEAHLSRHPQLSRVAVVAHGSAGTPQYVAYILSKNEAEPAAEELRNYVAAAVPVQALPALKFVLLKSLLALPLEGQPAFAASPEQSNSGGQVRDGNRRAVAQIVCAICAKVLRLKNVESGDNFLDLGGQSLAAIKMVMRTENIFQVPIPARKLFESATLGDFADILLDQGPRPEQTLHIAGILVGML
jgi:acyl carrier protein